jgi:hypothetical protein
MRTVGGVEDFRVIGGVRERRVCPHSTPAGLVRQPSFRAASLRLYPRSAPSLLECEWRSSSGREQLPGEGTEDPVGGG